LLLTYQETSKSTKYFTKQRLPWDILTYLKQYSS